MVCRTCVFVVAVAIGTILTSGEKSVFYICVLLVIRF